MSGAPVNHDAVTILRDLSPAFLEKYNKAGPRYTSYPTAPEWDRRVTQADLRAHIRRDSEAAPQSPLSLYFHIPFCEHRCRFCGCNVIVTTKMDVVAKYLEQLDAEMAIAAGEMGAGARRPVTQIHFGGGTPTFLTPDQFRWLMGRIRHHFNVVSEAEISLEADPCVTSDDHVRTLAALGFNRISYGVQDFHEPTQQLIERVQSVELTRHFLDLARECGYQSINFDLVYGLPLQTLATFRRTLDIVLEMRPDRIALYNFAYLPQKLAHQRYLNPALMPTGVEKFKIFVMAYEAFVGAGYEYIGMDHFAVPEDPLSEARRRRTIQRNFMGYTTQTGTDIYAFGVSSISATQGLYAQNVKKLTEYARALQAGELPVERGFILNDDDHIRKHVIYELMCHGGINKPRFAEQFGHRFDDYFAAEVAQLPPFAADGLLDLSRDRIEITLLGHIFARNIAMVFDAYLRAPQQKATFSRTL